MARQGTVPWSRSAHVARRPPRPGKTSARFDFAFSSAAAPGLLPPLSAIPSLWGHCAREHASLRRRLPLAATLLDAGRAASDDGCTSAIGLDRPRRPRARRAEAVASLEAADPALAALELAMGPTRSPRPATRARPAYADLVAGRRTPGAVRRRWPSIRALGCSLGHFARAISASPVKPPSLRRTVELDPAKTLADQALAALKGRAS